MFNFQPTNLNPFFFNNVSATALIPSKVSRPVGIISFGDNIKPSESSTELSSPGRNSSKYTYFIPFDFAQSSEAPVVMSIKNMLNNYNNYI